MNVDVGEQGTNCRPLRTARSGRPSPHVFHDVLLEKLLNEPQHSTICNPLAHFREKRCVRNRVKVTLQVRVYYPAVIYASDILVSAVVGCKHAVGAVEQTVSAAIAHLVATDINQRKDFCMSEQELKAELERLKTENEALKNRGSKAISMKVSEKGGVSIYGLGRFPVTLYKEQWIRLLDMADDIRSFIAENESKLKAKE